MDEGPLPPASASESLDLGEANRRIDALLDALERTADPVVRRQVQELVGLLLDVHAAAWERLLERVDGSALLDDELLSSLLLLHGLHPVPLAERVAGAVAGLDPALGASVELVDGGRVVARVRAGSGGASNARTAVLRAIEAAAPDAVVDVEVSTPIELRRLPVDR